MQMFFLDWTWIVRSLGGKLRDGAALSKTEVLPRSSSYKFISFFRSTGKAAWMVCMLLAAMNPHRSDPCPHGPSIMCLKPQRA